MRIGVFGGTFDPVHLGHLILAEQSREQARLDRVLFVPAARPPNKQHQAITPFSQRVEMLALAIAGHPAFQIDELEKDRPGPSYTVDTLEELHRRYPDDQLSLLIGSDCLSDLAHWRDPARICQLAELLIMARPGWSIEQFPTEANLPRDMHRQIIHAPMIDLASRDLRRRAAEGRSLRYLVPRAVECYISAHRLYQGETVAGPAASSIIANDT
jgi:nicotinate-nucleotide adenylyltransferase